MNTQKEKKMVKVRESTVCSRAKERVYKTTTVVTERKYKTHGGLKFNFDQKAKLTVPKPFSFDSGPKNRKVKPRSHSLERTPAKQTNGGTNAKGAKSELKIASGSLKVPKETRSSSKTRSVSREITQNSTTKTDTTQKKSCSRRSRSANPEVEPPKAENSPLPASKAVKSQASNASKSRGTVSSIAKSRAKTSNTSKPQVHFSDPKKSEVKVKGCSSSNASKSEVSTTKDTSNAVITERSLQNELKTKLDNEHTIEEDSKSGSLNGYGIHLGSDSSEAESPNEISLQKELESAMQIFESDISKNASKIPRKKHAAHSGMKFQANFKTETITEQTDFESTNYKMENTKSEVNHVQITNVVTN